MLKKFQERHRYLIKKNINICMLYSIGKISPNFPLRLYLRKFTGLPFEFQLKLINETLIKKESKILKPYFHKKSTISEMLNEITGSGILIFNDNKTEYHNEPVDEFYILSDTNINIKNKMIL